MDDLTEIEHDMLDKYGLIDPVDGALQFEYAESVVADFQSRLNEQKMAETPAVSEA